MTTSSEGFRSEEHTSELQSLMRISYAVFCLKKKKHKASTHARTTITTAPNSNTKEGRTRNISGHDSTNITTVESHTVGEQDTTRLDSTHMNTNNYASN